MRGPGAIVGGSVVGAGVGPRYKVKSSQVKTAAASGLYMYVQYYIMVYVTYMRNGYAI